MSNLLVQNIKHTNNTTALEINSSAQMTVKGEGSATTNLQQGLAKSWITFKSDSTFILRDSFNVSSAADVSTGHYDVNFTNNMNGTAYTPVSNVHYTGEESQDQYTRFSAPSYLRTTAYRIAGQYVNGGNEDGYFTVNTNGDLA